MLPCRLIHRKEKTKYEVVTGPLVDKVRDRSGDYNKNSAYDSIQFQFIHSYIICRKAADMQKAFIS